MNLRSALIAVAILVGTLAVAAAQPAEVQIPSHEVLTPEQWEAVDDGVDRGLAWLAAQQQPNGSFPTFATAQPAVTSLAVMAFLSRGHMPGDGPYGARLDRAIDYVLAQQQPEGLLYGGLTNMPVTMWNDGAHTANYNHAISGVMLGEAFGMTDDRRLNELRPAIEKALEFARRMQRRPSPHRLDQFGWRYYKHQQLPNKGEADLSCTAWYIMFYRSALNAGFNVPQDYVDDAMRFVRTCYDDRDGSFVYGPYPRDRLASRGMTGAGLLCLSLAGKHDVRIARTAGRWLLAHPFTTYNDHATERDRYHYGAYYASQAMFMVGGEEWKQFYPPLAETLVANQATGGWWQPESAENDEMFGNCYTTSLAILALTPPYQLLPIYQR